MSRASSGLLLWAALAALSPAQEVRVRFQLEPSEAGIVQVGKSGLKDRELPHRGPIYTLPEAAVGGTLRFSLKGYESQEQLLDRQTLESLPEDPENPGVRLYPPVALRAYGFQRFADFLRLHALGFTALGVGSILLGTLGVRFASKSRQDRHRLDQIEQLSAAGDPLVGRRLDHYLLTRRLGSGGMATVYKGIPFDTLDESQAVALKIILEEKRDEEFYQRFKREVEVTKSLNHPNTLRLFGWGEQEGIFFLIMELVPGQPLRAPKGGFPLAEFRSLVPSLMTSSRIT
jgi:hypothetical protein